MVAGLVAAADCRQQDAIWMALLDPPDTLRRWEIPSWTGHPCCCEAARTSVSTVLALEAEEDLEEVVGCSQHKMGDHQAEWQAADPP